jgi:hypothetical protein
MGEELKLKLELRCTFGPGFITRPLIGPMPSGPGKNRLRPQSITSSTRSYSINPSTIQASVQALAVEAALCFLV